MEKGFFGQYGGAYTNENTEKAVKEVAAAYEAMTKEVLELERREKDRLRDDGVR